MEFPHPFHENDRLSRTRGKHRGQGEGCVAVLVLAIITQAARWRAFPLPSPVGHMYSRGWTKVVGDIMEAGGRMDVGGFQFHMCELRSTTGTLSSGLGRTDARTDSTTSDVPCENPPCGSVCATTKQQLPASETTSARASKQRNPSPDHRWSSGDSQDTRISGDATAQWRSGWIPRFADRENRSNIWAE